MNITDYLKKRRQIVDEALDRLLPSSQEYPRSIHQAMRYAVFSGGKRIRPILAIAAAEAVGGKLSDVLIPAACIELIHAYSLVHDDMPMMDNADCRRGKLSVYKKFGEAIALMSGSALLSLAFEKVCGIIKTKSAQDVICSLAVACGTFGMIGGQVIDIESKTEACDLPKLQYINTHKTGALIAASLKVGGFCGGGRPVAVKKLYRFGEFLGLGFQVIDDALDNDGYASIYGVKAARREGIELCERAKAELKSFGVKGKRLNEIADVIAMRKR